MSAAAEIVLYEMREVRLCQSGDKYTVSVAGEQNNRREYKNPLAAWTYFVDEIDMRVRRRIGAMLDKQGKDPYTGE